MVRGKRAGDPLPGRQIAPLEQKEFPQDEWKEFLQTELGKAVSKYVEEKKAMEKAKEAVELAADKVAIEMGKAGKSYLQPQIDGVFYEFEISRTQAKLKFKRAKL